MANFSVEYSLESLSQLKKLDRKVAERIIKKIENAKINPRQIFRRLAGRPEYKLRVGDYRVIAHIEDNKNIIFTRTVGHRKNIYEKS